jgi:hypothetical protein
MPPTLQIGFNEFLRHYSKKVVVFIANVEDWAAYALYKNKLHKTPHRLNKYHVAENL